MSQVFSGEGFRTLRGSWALLGGALLASVAIVVASHWYVDRDRKEGIAAAQQLQQARSRVETARRERENLQASAEVFRQLVDRGLLQSERRLDMVELINALKARHNVAAVEYEIGAQRPLGLGGSPAPTALEVLASRVKLKARALHEGDLIGFINALGTSPQGFYPIDRCTLRRIPGDESKLTPRVEADCALEWITFKEKRG